MEVKEIVVSRSARMNLGNYEGLEHFISMKAEIDPEFDDVLVETRKLTGLVETAMGAQLHRSYQARGKKDMTPEKIRRHHGLPGYKAD